MCTMFGRSAIPTWIGNFLLRGPVPAPRKRSQKLEVSEVWKVLKATYDLAQTCVVKLQRVRMPRDDEASK